VPRELGALVLVDGVLHVGVRALDRHLALGIGLASAGVASSAQLGKQLESVDAGVSQSLALGQACAQR
jgi:hypothetical protein